MTDRLLMTLLAQYVRECPGPYMVVATYAMPVFLGELIQYYWYITTACEMSTSSSNIFDLLQSVVRCQPYVEGILILPGV